MKNTRRNSVVWKSVILYSIIFFIPFTVFVSYIYNASFTGKLSEIRNDQLQLLYQIRENISSSTTIINNIAQEMANTKDVCEFLEAKYNSSGEEIINYKMDVFPYLASRKALLSQIYSLFIFTYNSFIPPSYTKYVGVIGINDFPMKVPKDDYLSNDFWWIPPSADIELSNPMLQDNATMFIYNRPIYSQNDRNILGLISIQTETMTLFHTINDIPNDNGREIYIVQRDGIVLYSSAPYKIGEKLLQIAGSSNTDISKYLKSGGFISDDYNVVTLPLDDIACYVVSALPLKNIRSDISASITLTMLAAFGAFALVIFAVIIASFANSKRIRTLVEAMNMVNCGNYSIRVKVGTEDEIGKINITFNKMITKINEMIINVYQAEIKQKDARRLALEAQINPHFLYNMFTMIACTAKKNGDDEVQQMTLLLSKFYRIGLSDKADFISIREELNYLDMYIKIQAIRFGGRFEFKLEIDESLVEYRVIKNILHPLVENSIVHGIENIVGEMTGKITIQILCEEQQLMFIVTDNGFGMPEEQISHINRGIFSSDSSSGYGLKNISERLALFYGVNAGLMARSIHGGGIEMTVWVPVLQDGEKCIGY